MKRSMPTVIALTLATCVPGALRAAQQGTKPAPVRADFTFKTPGDGEALQIARIYADNAGETHWEFINIFPPTKPRVTGGVVPVYPPPPNGPSPLAPLERV